MLPQLGVDRSTLGPGFGGSICGGGALSPLAALAAGGGGGGPITGPGAGEGEGASAGAGLSWLPIGEPSMPVGSPNVPLLFIVKSVGISAVMRTVG